MLLYGISPKEMLYAEDLEQARKIEFESSLRSREKREREETSKIGDETYPATCISLISL